MDLNQRLFLFISILCSLTKLINSSNSYQTTWPINCLPMEIRQQLDVITEKVELKPENVNNPKITPNIISNCLEECKKKAQIAINQMNTAFTIGFAIINRSLNKKDVEKIVVRFVPEIAPKCSLSKKNENSKKIDCHCSTTNLRMYGSETSKSILEKIIKDVLSEKGKIFDINSLVDEIRKISKLKNCMVDFKTTSSSRKNSKSKNLNTTSVQKNCLQKPKTAIKLHRRTLTDNEREILREMFKKEVREMVDFWIRLANELREPGLKIMLLSLRGLLIVSLLYTYFFKQNLFRQTINSVLPEVFSGVPPYIWLIVLIYTCKLIDRTLANLAPKKRRD